MIKDYKSMKDFFIDIKKKLTYEDQRKEVQYSVVFQILFFVSIMMTLLNAYMHKGNLTFATFIFSIACIVNFIILKMFKNIGMIISALLFVIEIFVLFIFFIVSGKPEGFSAIWIAMLPSCGMILFGRKIATFLCSVMFGILAFFFWTPFGRHFLMYEYTDSFRQRFPLLFVAFFMMTLFLETVRVLTQNELDIARERNDYLSMHDELTGAYNRHGLKELILKTKVGQKQTVIMLDIDFFKKVNDNYGHDAGDIALKKIENYMQEKLDTIVCRWGGEEFVAWYPSGIESVQNIEGLRQFIESSDIQLSESETIHLTVSIGAVEGGENEDLENLINRADECLYKAKQTGRNKVVWENQE